MHHQIHQISLMKVLLKAYIKRPSWLMIVALTIFFTFLLLRFSSFLLLLPMAVLGDCIHILFLLYYTLLAVMLALSANPLHVLGVEHLLVARKLLIPSVLLNTLVFLVPAAVAVYIGVLEPAKAVIVLFFFSIAYLTLLVRPLYGVIAGLVVYAFDAYTATAFIILSIGGEIVYALARIPKVKLLTIGKVPIAIQHPVFVALLIGPVLLSSLVLAYIIPKDQIRLFASPLSTSVAIVGPLDPAKHFEIYAIASLWSALQLLLRLLESLPFAATRFIEAHFAPYIRGLYGALIVAINIVVSMLYGTAVLIAAFASFVIAGIGSLSNLEAVIAASVKAAIISLVDPENKDTYSRLILIYIALMFVYEQLVIRYNLSLTTLAIASLAPVLAVYLIAIAKGLIPQLYTFHAKRW